MLQFQTYQPLVELCQCTYSVLVYDATSEAMFTPSVKKMSLRLVDVELKSTIANAFAAKNMTEKVPA